MKKSVIQATLALCTCVVPAIGLASDGKITFKGTIEETTCSVNGGAGTDGGAQNLTVNLPRMSKTALSAANDRAGDTPFSVVIGGSGETDCADGKIVAMHFESSSSAVDSSTGRLLNSSAGGSADVVQVGILNDAGQDINLSDNTNNSTATIAGNTATLRFWAQYFAPTTGVTAGTVDTYVTYSLQYN